MLDVYTLLSSIIEPICPCWVGHYPTLQLDNNGLTIPKIYPYCEIKFPNILPNNTYSDNNLLTIDVWDNKDTDVTEIEGICDSIHGALNYMHQINETIAVSIIRDRPWKIEIPDPDINIQRRQLKYVVNVYPVIK
jgi:hypothetical protein